MESDVFSHIRFDRQQLHMNPPNDAWRKWERTYLRRVGVYLGVVVVAGTAIAWFHTDIAILAGGFFVLLGLRGAQATWRDLNTLRQLNKMFRTVTLK